MERYNAINDTHIATAELTPQRFKHPSELKPHLERAYYTLQRVLESTELPERIRKHPFYDLLKTRLTGNRQEVHKKRRNQARFIPEHKNEDLVQGTIAEFAELVCQTIETDLTIRLETEQRSRSVEGIRKTINFVLRENLKDIANEKIFHFGKDRKKRSGEVFKSRNEIKAAVIRIKQRVDSGTLDREKALIAVLHELGALSAKEIRHRSKSNGANGEAFDVQNYETDEIEDEILDSIKWASEYGSKKMEWINGLINKYLANGQLSGTFDRPSFNEELRLEDAFDLLVRFFLDENTDYRDGNDIQLILNDALLHWTWKRTFNRRNRKEYRAIEKEILDCLCVNQDGRYEIKMDTGPVLRYSQVAGEAKFETIPNAHERQQLYTLKPLHCPKGMRIQLYSYQMGEKSAESGVEKHLDDDQGKLFPAEVSDFFRTRFILWKITSKQIREDRELKNKITQALEKLGEQICGKGDSYEVVEPKETDKFIKWRLKGKTKAGIPIEIQWTPHDTYLFEHANGSPIAHEVYAESRSINRWRVKVPPSISPIMHQAFELREIELNAQREGCKAAMDDFDYEALEAAFKA